MQESRLKTALDTRFGDDLDEMIMVSEHGCSGGVAGFIYYYETRKFFNEYEEEIEQELRDIYGDYWFLEIAKLKAVDDTVTFKNMCVWIVVESYCQEVANKLEAEA